MVLLSGAALAATPVVAHHVLGRPAYSVSEDSNTTPRMQVETQIGKYFVSYMLYPAFPNAGEQGRIHLYATRLTDGVTFNGEVAFKVRNDTWFGIWFDEPEELLGVQTLSEGVYLQGFVFKEDGDYIITAEFSAEGEPYTVDFPLRVGDPKSALPLGIAGAAILLVLVIVNIVMRRRLLRAKIGTAHAREALP